jgi:hypothetical protein
MPRTLWCALLASSLCGSLVDSASAQATPPRATITRVGDVWTLENQVLRVVVAFSQGSVDIQSFSTGSSRGTRSSWASSPTRRTSFPPAPTA